MAEAAATPAGDDDGPVLVDARGLNCPMPVIELAKAMKDLAAGDEVRLLATDSTSKVDVPVWCRMQRQDLVEHGEADGEAGTEYRFLVRKR